MARAVRFGLVPFVFYSACLAALMYPEIARFHSHFFGDAGDGFTNIWNLWWVNKSLTELHQFPYYTNYLHHPHGTTLLGHTLNPLNGLFAIPLLRVVSITVAHNLIFVFAFVFAGMSAFWLAHQETRAYAASLFAGFVFTFCNYHFAHAEGHLNLVSLEFIPLYALLARRLLAEPTVGRGAAAGATLLVVLLCDHYYFFYCFLLTILVFAAYILRARPLALLVERRRLAAVGVFAAVALAGAAPFVYAITQQQATDPLLGGHDPREFSLDALGLFIPGGHWRWNELTKWYWQRLPGNPHEKSVHLGLCVLALALLGAIRRRQLALWSVVLVLFTALALGPLLQVGGRPVAFAAMPYTWLTTLIPPLRLSGMPVRMVVMATLGAAVLAAGALDLLLRGAAWQRALAGLLVLGTVVEFLPRPIPVTSVVLPDYVEKLRALPPGGLLDARSDQCSALYYQTVHKKPMTFGYISRVPRSVWIKNRPIYELSNVGDFRALCERFKIRYVVDNGGKLHDAGPGCD